MSFTFTHQQLQSLKLDFRLRGNDAIAVWANACNTLSRCGALRKTVLRLHSET